MPCSSCSDGCGLIIQMQSYEKCEMVGVGQGEHCQCFDFEVVVGYIYPCTKYWDDAKIAWCLLRTSCCVVQCGSGNAAGCANCLAAFSKDCCPDGCEVCDFVIGCGQDPYAVGEEITRRVFVTFGC